jgi:hypothetical protein
MASIEVDAETVIIAVLNAWPAFTALNLPAVHYTTTDDEAQSDRVVVECMTPSPAARNGKGSKVLVWNALVSIQGFIITRTDPPNLMSQAVSAIEAALQSPTDSSVIALAASLFPNGIEIRVPTDEERQNDYQDTQRFSRTYGFWIERDN